MYSTKEILKKCTVRDSMSRALESVQCTFPHVSIVHRIFEEKSVSVGSSITFSLAVFVTKDFEF